MSIDKSLKSRDTLQRHRNVLTRAERIEHLREADHWTDGSSPFGLPKIGHRKAAVGKKVKEEKTTDGDAAATETDTPATEEKKS
ncbi:MAG: small basic protein [Planctomycetes bacterium]|nr:small basic protein [Planctomycetota bacterium]MCH7632447.1 small basic protein [Planctomycetota bacterium]